MEQGLETSEELDRNSFIYVPSMGLYVAKERTHQGKNWYEAHEALSKEGQRMLNLREFTEFLKYTKKHSPGVFGDITQVRNLWRAEHLDAYFEQREGGLYVLTGNKTNAEKLDSDTLIQDKLPGISLEAWISNPTSQGLPRSDVEKGDLYHWHPRDGCFAGFRANSIGANLVFDGFHLYRYDNLGVRAVKEVL